ncbi:hypothetical protein [Thioalkalivibrio sp. ALJ16]|uniref:hypothetical protein n=1 Tax=Thioalkalivibrio sp. ALJ16 TaxID=1158762 RepID=UPI000373C0EA|nr:hypothetical protein [Thioalkalivibrio sp. ALJ16]
MSQALKSSIYATTFFVLSVLSFGVNDWFSLLMLVASIVFLYPTILVGQMTLRNVAKTAIQKDSALYAFLNQPKTVAQQLFSIAMAIVLGISFLTVSKGIEMNHGLLPVVVIIFFLAWWISGRLVAHPDLALLEQQHLQKKALYASVREGGIDGSESGSPDVSFLSLFAAILVLNLLFALLLSAKDLFTFFVADVTFANFRSYALERGIEAGAFNSISRVFINVYVIFDSFKIAAANEILLALGIDKSGSHSAYYLFYLLVLAFNILKLLAFSVPLVFLQRGLLVRGASLFEAPAKRLGRILLPYIKALADRIKPVVHPLVLGIKGWFKEGHRDDADGPTNAAGSKFDSEKKGSKGKHEEKQ